MRKVGLVPNLDRDPDLSVTRALASFIHSRGRAAFIETAFFDRLAASAPFAAQPLVDVYQARVVDFLVVLGGDGTVLNAAQKASVANIPLIGVNLGRLGYLTDTDRKGAAKALDRVFNGTYKSEKRMMVETAIVSQKGTTPPLALNDVCVLKRDGSRLIELRVYVNGDYIDRFRADGVLISTPTGSTAYNLSAGGPILKPDAEMIAITPICPHTLYARPFVVSSKDVITIRLADQAVVAMDGQDAAAVFAGDTVTVRKSSHYTTILKTNRLGFYDILRLKMIGDYNENDETIEDH